VRRPSASVIGAALVLAALLQLADVRLAASQTMTVAARFTAEAPSADPWDPIWSRVVPGELPLSAQLIVAPKGGTREHVRVRAVHDRTTLFVLLEWPDATAERRIDGVDAFADAAALQFPAGGGTSVPPLCMGSPTAGVNIWHWKAAWEAGGSDPTRIASAFPRVAVDPYPFATDPLYAPARALGNSLAQREHASSVENLRAGRYGTLTAAVDQPVAGAGEWRDGTWRVLFRRALEAPADGDVAFAAGRSVDAAAALWDGASRERNGMKAVSAFFALRVTDSPLPPAPLPLIPWLLLAPLAIAVFLGIIVLVARAGARSRP